MAVRTLALVFIVILLASSSRSTVISSVYDQVDTSISFFPFSPSIRAGMGIFTATFDQVRDSPP